MSDLRVLHPDTVQVVDEMAIKLKIKLLKAQEKYNLVDGWKHPPEGMLGDGRFFLNGADCNRALKNHIEKGDIVDCIAYLTFMLDQGWKLDI